MFFSLTDEGARLRIIDGMLVEEDLLALRCSIVARGLMDRSEAEVIFALDRMQLTPASGWENLYVDGLVSFVLWQERPTGRLSEEQTDWLIACLGDLPTARGRALLNRMAEDCAELPHRLRSLQARMERKAKR